MIPTIQSRKMTSFLASALKVNWSQEIMSLKRLSFGRGDSADHRSLLSSIECEVQDDEAFFVGLRGPEET